LANKDFKVKNSIVIPTPLALTEGGTGQTSASNALNALLPVQTDNTSKVLQTNGTSTSWVTLPNGYAKGDTASRPGSPALGDIYSNTETGAIEVYTSAGWSAIGVIPKTPTIGSATDVGTSRAFNNGAGTIAFTPDETGGLASVYTATSSPGGFTGTNSSSPVTVAGLQSNTAYTFTVIATNSYGNATATGPTSSITATTVPQAPTVGSPSATGASGQILVPITANGTGGSSITGYTVTSSPGNITGSGSSSPIIVSGLTNGTSYTFTATATNTNGTSLSSSSSSSASPVAFTLVSGGQETVTVGGYVYRIFTSSGTLAITGAGNVEAIAVGGGGGGGSRQGGGGGAGAIEPATGYQTVSLSGNTTVTIGAGATGGRNQNFSGTSGNVGGSTVFSTLTALGGGGGGGTQSTGGSGGGGGSQSNIAGTGNNTFPGGQSRSYIGGGGGGSAQAGADASGQNAGKGGDGKLLSNIDTNLTAANFPITLTGITRFAAGGGGGNSAQSIGQSFNGAGGAGGGGVGGYIIYGAGSGTSPGNGSGYGSGGGGSAEGAFNAWPDGGTGSSGIVIVRVPV